MHKTEQLVLQLAKKYKNPDDFLRVLAKYMDIIHVNESKYGEFLFTVGNVLFNSSYFFLARNTWKQALKYFIKKGNISGKVACYGNLGMSYESLGDYRRAIEYHEKALKICEEIEDIAGESRCYINLGSAYDGLGDYRRAIEYQEKALKICRVIQDKAGQSTCNFNLGLLYFESKPKLAYDYGKRSIELSEMMSGGLVEEKHKIGFQAQTSGAFQLMVPLCLKLDKEKEAFEYVERGKSRAFLDLLSSTEIKPTVKLTSELKSLLNEEEKYLSKLREIQTRHLRKTKVVVEIGDVEAIYKKLNHIYDELDNLDPEYVYMRRAKPLTLDKIQKLLSSQKRDTVLIEYFVTNKETFIFVISSKDKKMHVKTVPLSSEKLVEYKESFEREVANNVPIHGAYRNTWLELSNFLIEPISEFLKKDELVYFVPYGVLHSMPLHALELNGEPLIKNHPVAYVPSASLIKFCQNKGSEKLQTCLSFAVVKEKLMMIPIEKTSNAIVDLFDSKEIYVADLATKQKVLEKCIDKDVIHFSCHGNFDENDPLSSGIQLYNEEILSTREIFDLKLNSEIVTLGACETGVNLRIRGDELVGLTRAFLYAGAASVVVSLWDVDVLATRTLLVEFYKQLKTGVDRTSALQEAQKKAMKKYPNMPHYWAPFILVGKT